MIGLDGVVHRNLEVNGIRIHLVEQGAGPLVLLVHGFPESWYSWRHQLPALAAAGYRAVALDVRGYGRSTKPASIEEYRMTRLVDDIVGLVGALGEERAVLVGHDWGAPIAWNSALTRPDLFGGLVLLSVPYHPRSSMTPSLFYRAMAGEDELYMEYFQQPGRAEAEIEADVRDWLASFYYSLSGDAPADLPSFAIVPRGARLRDRLVRPEELPPWLSAADLDFYAAEFERTGFTGALNRYRNMDRDWEDLVAFEDRPIEIPAMFIGGSRDGPTLWGAAAVERLPQTMPELYRSVVLEGCGHWIQQERPEQTNALLVEFLEAIELSSSRPSPVGCGSVPWPPAASRCHGRLDPPVAPVVGCQDEAVTMAKQGVSEADWKVFREVREKALERFCERVLDEVERLCSDAGRSHHERYLAVFRMLRARDEKLAHAFNDPRRSTMVLQLAAIHSMGLLEPEEIARFIPETRQSVEWLAGPRS